MTALLAGVLLSAPCWANTAPTLVSSVGVTASSGTLTTASISWQSGDIVVAAATDEGAISGEVPNTPTATGLSFSAVLTHSSTGSDCGLGIWTASPVASSSATVSFTDSQTSKQHNGWVWVFRSSGGLGNHASQFTTTKTVSLTPAGGADSAIIWEVGDFSAAASPVATPTTPNETTKQAIQDGTAMSYVTAQITDQTSAGTVSYGVNYTSAGPFSIGVLEIKGTAGGGGGPTCTLSLMGAGPC